MQGKPDRVRWALASVVAIFGAAACAGASNSEVASETEMESNEPEDPIGSSASNDNDATPSDDNSVMANDPGAGSTPDTGGTPGDQTDDGTQTAPDTATDSASGGTPSSSPTDAAGGAGAIPDETGSGGGDSADSESDPPSDAAPTACEATSWTEAIHLKVDTTWPASLALADSAGRIDFWVRGEVNASGTDLELAAIPCGVIMPPAPLSVAGILASGGENLLIELPSKVWETPGNVPSLGNGTRSGGEVGSTITESTFMLLGVSLDDPMAEWPASATGLTTVDFDQDGKPGLTGYFHNGDGYVYPPTTVGIAGSAPAAEEAYLAIRLVGTMNGEMTACDAHSGEADVSAFDIHVVGCSVHDGGPCNGDQADFVDQNRMLYSVTSATYEAKVIPDGASCADVVAALPAQ